VLGAARFAVLDAQGNDATAPLTLEVYGDPVQAKLRCDPAQFGRTPQMGNEAHANLPRHGRELSKTNRVLAMTTWSVSGVSWAMSSSISKTLDESSCPKLMQKGYGLTCPLIMVN
jgi:hypothetical protein